jgi:DNA-binding transcriptional ArsR family regulator
MTATNSSNKKQSFFNNNYCAGGEDYLHRRRIISDDHADNGGRDTNYVNDTLHVGQLIISITPSQERMLKHMAYLQTNRGIACVCWRDFLELNLTHGTIRNNLSKLKKMGLIERSHKGNDAYYTIAQDSLQNTMTLDRIWVTTITTKPQLASLIDSIAYDSPAVHNIRLVFRCPTIYNTLLRLKAAEKILPKSEDLVLSRETLEKGAIKAGIIVHKNDLVSISLACSDHPIHFNIAGLVILNSSLTRVEEQLRSKVLNLIDIPYYGSWIVKMWHIGVDSSQRYTGPAYEETWDHITGVMYRVYVKLMKKEKTRVLRLERQEYPNNPVHDAVEQTLSRVLGDAATPRGIAGQGGVVVAV